jgi:carbonic anhydrase/acetyltransferase-like protein (isoleucine patch superfamily)
MKNYRLLTENEIHLLTSKGCTAEKWEMVRVSEGFKPDYIAEVHFSGNIFLGNFNKIFVLAGGLQRHAGIRRCCLHNCTIEDDVYIDQVANYIANYHIGEGSYIENVNLLVVEKDSTFGNGVKVPVMNEGGGREIPIFDFLSAPLAYVLTLYRHRPVLIQKIQKLIDDYACKLKSDTGTIGKNVRIVNAGSIKNVRIGDCANIEGASCLINGSINSNAFAPVTIGAGVKCDDFIISSGVSVTDSTLISRCFIGQGCILGKHYSVLDSLFFSNCQGMHGEATAIFAGPYTVSHHKSTLLIAGMFSFLNAGSGSNQSNHMYKLGPIHQGLAERGAKTTSDSYLLWPAKIGAFTLVMGRHTKHSDTSDLPFSYLIENATDSFLVPAVNLRSVGTIRDAQKWPKRDNRKDPKKLDPINFNLLSPYTIQKMMKGVEVLKNLQKISGETTEIYTYQNCSIKNSSLLRGIDLYHIGIYKFLGNSLISRLKDKHFNTIEDIREILKPDTSVGSGEWIDLSGLIAPKTEIEQLMKKIEDQPITLEDIQREFEKMHEAYYNYEWTWAKEKLEIYWRKPIAEVTREDLIQMVELWKNSVVTLDHLIYDDAKKEFSLNAKTGFGVDGDEQQKSLDFESVRGSFENNPFVLEVINHIKIKSELGDELLDRLKKVIN